MFHEYQDIMSVFDVAEALNIGKNRVYELLESGAIKGFHIGKVWKIPKESLKEFVLQHAKLNHSQH